jgi:hypothetical protein
MVFIVKHVDLRKDDRPIKKVKKGERYTNNDLKHSKNQAAYVFKEKSFIL